jgi:hypothetical protein
MARRLRGCGFVLEEASIFPILNLEWGDDTYSKGIARFICDFVARRGEVDKDEVAAWYAEFPRLSGEGRYFFSTGRVIFVASKPD